MTNCPPRVSRAISEVKGVQKVDVSFDRKEAQVTSNRCDEAFEKDVGAALDSAGYGGKVVKNQPAS